MLDNILMKTAIKGATIYRGNVWKTYTSIMTIRELVELVDFEKIENIHETPPCVESIASMVKMISSIVIEVQNDDDNTPKWYGGVFEKDGQSFYDCGCIEFPVGTRFVALNNNDKMNYFNGLYQMFVNGHYNKCLDSDIPVTFIREYNKNTTKE